MNACFTSRMTRMRLVPGHACPDSDSPPLMARSTALSRSASSITIRGFLPPSSICVRVVIGTDLWICSPAAVEPVNDTARTARDSTMVGPTSAALPVRKLSTPFGMPALTKASASR
ncbi:hypothetical protein D3C86_1449480 [compost metagenome]